MNRIAKWMAGLAGALCLVPGPADAADQPACKLTRYASLPLTTEPEGRVAVPVSVEGKNYSFLVDTGGAVATIGPDQAEELGVRQKGAAHALTGVAGRFTTSYMSIDSFSIGKLSGSGLDVYVEPRGDLGFDGTLAPDMMKHYDVDLDFAHSRMNLFSQDHCPGKVVYWTQQGGYIVLPMQVDGGAHIRIPVMLDGKSITAIVDTGATDSIMSMRAAESLGITEDAPDLKLKNSEGFRKRFKEYTYPFHTLDMGGVMVKNPNIIIASNEFMGSFRSDMILGIGILRQLHLYIAYKEEKFYISPALAN
jgi:predicted aspartyl protease